MSKAKKEVEVASVEKEVGVANNDCEACVCKINLLTTTYSNGELNELKDKINEIIRNF